MRDVLKRLFGNELTVAKDCDLVRNVSQLVEFVRDVDDADAAML